MVFNPFRYLFDSYINIIRFIIFYIKLITLKEEAFIIMDLANQ